MLHHLERDAEAGASEESRRDGIEGLAASVADGCRRLAETEVGCDELDVDRAAGERRGELVVVRGRERRRVGDDDSHRQYSRTPGCPDLEPLPREHAAAG